MPSSRRLLAMAAAFWQIIAGSSPAESAVPPLRTTGELFGCEGDGNPSASGAEDTAFDSRASDHRTTHARMTRNDARDDPCPTTRTVYARRMTATRTATVEFTGARPAIE